MGSALGTRSGSPERVLEAVKEAVASVVTTAMADRSWRAAYDAEVWRDEPRRERGAV
jgi:hypothetical protein